MIEDKERQKILLCDNYILDSKKIYTLQELRLFYFVLYKYREMNLWIEPNTVPSIFLVVEQYDINKLFAKSRMMASEIIRIVESIPDSIVMIDKHGNNFKKIYIFSSIVYREDDCIEFQFNDDCLEYLDNVYNNFSNINLYDLFKLRSKYSQRLYELSCRYVNQKIYLMPIAVFRRYFGIADTYSNAEIKRRILTPSTSEVTNKTKIKVDFSYKLRGKVVSHVEFTFSGGYHIPKKKDYSMNFKK